ncbi:MAG: DUF2341 domain-containing protein, partial [Euryarchaeota archaeon]|nr:DUF2341 domain-containing protein [Euryarchaeota archaeon]
MNKKTVSPIIAVVLLITITLTAAMLLRTWYFGEQQESQERTSGLIDKKIRETEEKINVESYDTNGTLYIRNTGLTTIDMNATKIYEEGSMLNITVPQLLSGEVESVNLTLDMNKTYKITTATGYTAMFEYAVGNVFLYSGDEIIFNNGDTTIITAITVDNFDNRVGSGIDVTFQTTLGGFDDGMGGTTPTLTVPTNASGEATATLVSGTETGRAKISTIAGNYTSMSSVTIEYWWDTDWTKRKKITIAENSGNDLTDYQIDLSIVHDGDMKANYEDLRFIDSDHNELSYWIEDNAADPATVWVKILSIPEISTATVYMYYGNALASSESNGTATFVFFDSFENDTVGNEPSKWKFGGCTAYFGGSGNGNSNAQRHQV